MSIGYRIERLDTHVLEIERDQLEDEIQGLIEDINGWDIVDDHKEYHEAAMALVSFLELPEHQHLEFIGSKAWASGCPRELCDKWAAGSESERYSALENLKDEIWGWGDGVELIADSDFAEFAEEEADSQGVKTQDWPMTSIDWDKAAEELQEDYTQVEYDGVDWWYRS